MPRPPSVPMLAISGLATLTLILGCFAAMPAAEAMPRPPQAAMVATTDAVMPGDPVVTVRDHGHGNGYGRDGRFRYRSGHGPWRHHRFHR